MVSRGFTSPHGFAVVRGRGRGYRCVQVDERVSGLSRERDEAWERAARLTVLAKDMAADAERLRERAAQLPEQTYESLGARARQLLVLAEEEALVVRKGAQEQARQVAEVAEREAREASEAARVYAEALRAEADEQAGRRLLEDRALADEWGATAREEAREARAEALTILREMRQRVTGLLAEQKSELAERWALAERQIAERDGELKARHAELTAQAEARLRQARQDLAEAQEAAGRVVDDAEACAAELLAEARMREERIGREAQRSVREHRSRREEMLIHMDRVHNSLLALPGVGAVAPTEDGAGAGA